MKRIVVFLLSTIFTGVVYAQKVEDPSIRTVLNECRAMDAEGSLHGGILIAKNQEIIYQKAFGNSPAGSNKESTVFNIASMGKMFTALSILQLVQAEKIAIDSKVGDILPEYSNHKSSKEISIFHLLTHTNGIPEVFQMNLGIDPMNPSEISHKELVEVLSKKRLKHKPGKKWSYTNSGYVLLGRIIEKISNMSYCEYVKENILEPSGMLSTGCGFGAGGAESTMEDMFRFSKALLSNKLISKELKESAMSKKASVENEVGYGFGFFVTKMNGGKEVSHSGGVPEMINCQLLMFVDSGYTVVIFSNNPKGFDSYHKLRKLIRRHLSSV